MPKEIADQLRAAIIKSGLSANELAKATGVAQTTISGFLRGRGMSIDLASKLAAHLHLELRKR
jgi:transcriptional regulator with XRE-family HTH domain